MLHLITADGPELLYNVEFVLVAEEAPYDGHILDDNHKWYGAQSTQNTRDELEIAIAFDAKRLDGADEVQVQVDGANKAAQKVEELSDRNGIKSREVDVGSGER